MLIEQAEVLRELPGVRYRLNVLDSGRQVVAYPGSQVRRQRLPREGDVVEVEFHESNNATGRIVRIIKPAVKMRKRR